MKANEWDTFYEWKAVTPLALGFGLLGLSRSRTLLYAACGDGEQ